MNDLDLRIDTLVVTGDDPGRFVPGELRARVAEAIRLRLDAGTLPEAGLHVDELRVDVSIPHGGDGVWPSVAKGAARAVAERVAAPGAPSVIGGRGPEPGSRGEG